MRMLLRASLFFVYIAPLVANAFAASAADASQIQDGAALYELRCSGCHGEKLRNLSGGWSFDLRKLRPNQHDQFVNSVISGRENMPSWYGILKAEEIEAIWAYIRATVDN